MHNTCAVETNNANKTKTLYRGDKSSQSPDIVFNSGIKPKGTHNDPLLHTKSNSTAGNFVSTSESFDIANDFAGKNGYVYVINSNKHIDINTTFGSKTVFPEQKEFSIIGEVSPSQIIGAYKKENGKVVGGLIINPNYRGGS